MRLRSSSSAVRPPTVGTSRSSFRVQPALYGHHQNKSGPRSAGHAHDAMGQPAPRDHEDLRERLLAHAFECVSPAHSFTSTLALLFLLAGREARSPSRGLLAWRRSYCLDLLFLGLLGFPVTVLLALGHVDLLLD